MRRIDPVTLQVIKTGLKGVVREMQLLLFRTGYSTAIRESHDASCAILDRQGRLIAQYESLATHMAIFQVSMRALFQNYPLGAIEEGDAFILNHPYQGCSTHVSDMAVITPIFYQKKVVAFCASIAHKTDIGGAVPGSASGSATEIFQEGLLLPPIKYVSRGKQSREIEQVLRANSRTPDVLTGDIRGQVGVCRIGEVRVEELMDKYGEDRILGSFEDLMDSTEQRMRAGIRQWRDGKAEMDAFLDPDGIVVHKPVRLHLAVTKEGDGILFDFSGCDDQTNAPLNLKPAAAMSAVYFALIAMIDPTLPNNDGLGRAIQTRFRPGSVVSPEPPAAVSCYTVTLGMVREIVVAAMTKIAHQRAIACNGGLPVVTIGGKSLMTGRTYIQYEIGGAGCGAVDGDDGRAGHVGLRGAPGHVRTVPVEIVESEFACRILRYELIPDSGGPGKFRGGPAWVKNYLILDDEARLGLRSSMYVFAAWGVEGGMHGRPGAATLNPGTPLERRLPPRIADVRLKRGDVLRIESGGGGGVGNPRERPRKKVMEDVEDGYVSEAQAKGIYGLALP